MALSFTAAKGGAQSKKVDSYVYKDGENVVRLVGGILPRYIYWIKGTNNKDIPVECLAFSRENEKFDNIEVDHMATFHPEVKCGWAYTMNCIDPKDGKVRALNLKKKLYAQIVEAAESLGDPTDPDTGWDIVFKKAKTGPLAYNVEYTLSVLKCKNRPLTDAERAEVAAAKTIDQLFPRATPDEVLALLKKIQAGDTSSGEEDVGTDGEAVKDLQH